LFGARVPPDTTDEANGSNPWGNVPESPPERSFCVIGQDQSAENQEQAHEKVNYEQDRFERFAHDL